MILPSVADLNSMASILAEEGTNHSTRLQVTHPSLTLIAMESGRGPLQARFWGCLQSLLPCIDLYQQLDADGRSTGHCLETCARIPRWLQKVKRAGLLLTSAILLTAIITKDSDTKETLRKAIEALKPAESLSRRFHQEPRVSRKNLWIIRESNCLMMASEPGDLSRLENLFTSTIPATDADIKSEITKKANWATDLEPIEFFLALGTGVSTVLRDSVGGDHCASCKGPPDPDASRHDFGAWTATRPLLVVAYQHATLNRLLSAVWRRRHVERAQDGDLRFHPALAAESKASRLVAHISPHVGAGGDHHQGLGYQGHDEKGTSLQNRFLADSTKTLRSMRQRSSSCKRQTS